MRLKDALVRYKKYGTLSMIEIFYKAKLLIQSQLGFKRNIGHTHVMEPIYRRFSCRCPVSLNSRCPKGISKDSLTEYQFYLQDKSIYDENVT